MTKKICSICEGTGEEIVFDSNGLPVEIICGNCDENCEEL